jgi:hypothetical protein
MTVDTENVAQLGGKNIEEWAWERNLLALGFVRAAHEMGFDAGVRFTDDPEYPALFVPLDVGEVGWHIPHDLYTDHREWLPKRVAEFNGYTSEAKNRRLQTWAYRGPR